MGYAILRTDNSNNYIVDLDTMGLHKYVFGKSLSQYEFSLKWRLIGFCEIQKFGRLGRLIKPLELLESKDLNMTFKNGKGRYVLIDYDHGTMRQWGDRIMSVRYIT